MSRFPITLGGTTFNESDFTGLGYVDAIPNSIEAIGDQLLNSPLSGTSTTTITSGVTVGFDTITFTTQPGKAFKTNDRLNIASTTYEVSLERIYMSALVVSYNRTTGALIVRITACNKSGHSINSWTISLSMPSGSPLPLTDVQGGTGCSSFRGVATHLNICAPHYNMQLVEDDFICPPSLSRNSPPWYLSSETTGTGTISVGPRTPSNTYRGSGGLEITGSGDSDNISRLYMAYGRLPFVSIEGGPLSADFAVNASHDPTSGNPFTLRFGLRGRGSTEGVDFFDYFAIGWEIGPDTDYELSVIVASPGQRTVVPLGIDLRSSSRYDRFHLDIDTNSNEIVFYEPGGSSVSAELPTITGFSALMHPAISVDFAGSASRTVGFDYVRLGKRLNRRPVNAD